MNDAPVTGLHWKTSVGLNRILCGSANMPLCARIHEAPPSRARAVTMFLLDMAFAEYQHTARVHRCWLALSS